MTTPMRDSDKIYVAGHRGMVGSAILRHLKARGFKNLIVRPRSELDLTNQADVRDFFQQTHPDYVFLAAARVGGILANSQHQAEFLYENLTIQNHVIHEAWRANAKKLCFLGSSCIYPKQCPHPIKEEHLLSGPLEPTNEGYAIAKIAGLKLVEHYRKQHGFNAISVMPCNLYGTNDCFDPDKSHVLSALVRKFVDAVDDNMTTVDIWGTGQPRREFLHVNDLAAATVFLMEAYESGEPINVGSGEDLPIAALAKIIAEESGFTGTMNFDHTKPDGTMRKCLDISKLTALGFRPNINLRDGVHKTVAEYRKLKSNTATAR